MKYETIPYILTSYVTVRLRSYLIIPFAPRLLGFLEFLDHTPDRYQIKHLTY